LSKFWGAPFFKSQLTLEVDLDKSMQIIMPKLGLTMTEGTLTRWRKAAGESVEPGEILFEFESEKSALEFESPTVGVLTEILVAAGQTVPCGTPVCIVGARSQPTTISAAPALQKTALLQPSTYLSVENQASRLPATPRAKARAHETCINFRVAALMDGFN
jgi:pyruvate dehydrogenase E2 component (dihydrolipoamide acetyltransferase)